jgi:hypothetical protein
MVYFMMQSDAHYSLVSNVTWKVVADVTILLLQQIGNIMTYWYSFSCHGMTVPYLLKGMLLNHVNYQAIP